MCGGDRVVIKCLGLADMWFSWQDLYDKLKRKMLLANVQNAANETAEHLVMSGVGMAGQEGAHGGGGGGGAGAGGVGGDGMRQIRFSGGGMNNPITIDEVSGNMGGLRMAGGGGGGVGGNQSTGQGRNSSFGMRGSNNTGGAGMNNMRAGGPNGSGRNNGNNGMYMGMVMFPSRPLHGANIVTAHSLIIAIYRHRHDPLPNTTTSTRWWAWSWWWKRNEWHEHEYDTVDTPPPASHPHSSEWSTAVLARERQFFFVWRSIFRWNGGHG